MDHDEYLRELRHRLRFRGASRKRVDDIVGEVDSHLRDSGEDPVAAFGLPDKYAASLLHSWWHSVRFMLAVIALTLAGAIVANAAPAVADGFGPALAGDRPPIELSGRQLLHLLPFLLIAGVTQLPVAHSRLSQRGRLGAGIVTGVGGGVVVVLLGDRGLAPALVLTISPTVALAAVVGLVSAGALLMLEPQLRRWLPRAGGSERRREPAG
ncbi:hypothetical protein JQS43_17735 [Natronosporangium hydrolyticum]|uniref:Uncharacterized protein n=1 Tax=Natronosporangium hydrolyticum TaxID=2811111 RepID=A0A895YFW6_9ACTN|nr:hypothetical protein [Natronosporangium hydrolyticum]QSB13436.1 hypothetical protein JQS43_17735 [Natronosporangium hydrolyticum]